MKGSFRPERQIGVGSVRISEREKRYVQDVLDRNRLSYGPYSRRLEREFAAAHDCNHAVLTNSGTSSLQIAVAALKERHSWADGDEILCPAATFVATGNVILQNGLEPVFVDVEPDTYNMDPRQLEQHVGERTRGLMVAHLYGQPADMDPLLEVAGKHGLRIIEDSAETMFARYRGRSVGSFGDIGCFSTYACHIMVTGVGGIAATRDAELAVLLRSLANHGRDNIYLSMDDDSGKSGHELQEVMARRFSFVRPGYSYRITEMEAALGVGQLEGAPEAVATRRAVADRLLQGLQRWEGVLQLPGQKPDRDHSFMMFPLLVREGAPFSREEIALYLEEQRIETRPMVSLLDQPFYRRRFGDLEDHYPVARWIDRCGFYIGCHPEMDADVVDYVLEVFHRFLAGEEPGGTA
jgi:dTDP-4-amino-4,6-dideoxygalactose transaminase